MPVMLEGVRAHEVSPAFVGRETELSTLDDACERARGGTPGAVLLGAEFNAELERGRRIEGGHPEDEEPFVEPRDTRKLD